MVLLIRLVSLLFVVATWLDTTLGDARLGLVSRRNHVRKQAAEAYRLGRFQEALTHYQYLVRTSPTPSLGERVNLGHTYFRLGQYTAARQQYEQDGTEAIPSLRAVAAAQLGVLACLQRDTTAALQYCRRALLNDPENSVARQNFELLTRRFSGKSPRRKAVQQTPPPRPQSEATRSQQVEKTRQQQDKLNRQAGAALSDEQARQILDALQADDLPYALARRRGARPAADKQTGRW